MFARLEHIHVGQLPAAITSGLGRFGGGLSVPLPGQDNDGFRGSGEASNQKGLYSGNGFQVLR